MDSFHTSYRRLWSRLVPLYGRDEAQAIVRTVLDDQFGLSLTDIVCGGVESLSQSQQAGLEGTMRRLESGEPMQYVLGHADFCGRSYHVGPGVLIPRPETEELCRLIVGDSLRRGGTGRRAGLRILDIGTGSGCIAITLALDIPGSAVSAMDISEEALGTARANAAALGATVGFFRQDILAASRLGDTAESGQVRFDIIVSNPPYIALGEKDGMRRNVLDHEPATALFVPDDDPLLFYRAIAAFAVGNLSEGGQLWFEINPLFADGLRAMLAAKGFNRVEIMADSFGRQRFAVASRK